jgi:DnaJ-class molecular chaperone
MQWGFLFMASHPQSMKDHYSTLGLSPSANLADIKKAYRLLASQLHPDRNPDAQAPQRFRSVQEAYDVLSDEVKRQAYDDNRRRNLLDSPIDTAKEIWRSYMERMERIQ